MLFWRIFKLKESKVWIRKRSSLKSLGERTCGRLCGGGGGGRGQPVGTGPRPRRG